MARGAAHRCRRQGGEFTGQENRWRQRLRRAAVARISQPPHKLPYATTLFEKAVRELGYHPYPVPTATLSRTYTNPDGITRPACAYCGYCSRYGCMIGAKAQPTNVLMPVLAKRKNRQQIDKSGGEPGGGSR